MTTDLHEDDCGCTEYRELSRRQFVGTAAGGSMAAVAASYFPAWLPKVVLAESYASARDVILSVFMRGGADGSRCVFPSVIPPIIPAVPQSPFLGLTPRARRRTRVSRSTISSRSRRRWLV